MAVNVNNTLSHMGLATPGPTSDALTQASVVATQALVAATVALVAVTLASVGTPEALGPASAGSPAPDQASAVAPAASRRWSKGSFALTLALVAPTQASLATTQARVAAVQTSAAGPHASWHYPQVWERPPPVSAGISMLRSWFPATGAGDHNHEP